MSVDKTGRQMMTKIHYHSDLYYFGGSENMISNFLNSDSLNAAYQISLSFRFTKEYDNGLRQRLRRATSLHPIQLPNFSIYKKKAICSRSNFNKLSDYVIYLIEYIPKALLTLFLLARLFRHIKPEILHVNNGGYPGALSCRIAVLAAKLVGIQNIVFVVNNMAVNYKHPYRWPDFFVDRLVARYTSFFITGSPITMARLKTVLPILESKTASFPNGINVRNTSETQAQTRARLGLEEFNGTIFGVIGVMEHRKGHMHLLKSIKILLESKRVDAKSLVVLIEGSGGVRLSLEKFTRDHDLMGVVKFIDTEDQIFNFIKVIDVLIYPAIQNEDFPNVISEAMALSKPVIATKVAGAVEQVQHEQTGLLVDVLSEVQLANALGVLSKDRKKIQYMGELARKRYIDFYTAEKSVKNYERLYVDLLKTLSD